MDTAINRAKSRLTFVLVIFVGCFAVARADSKSGPNASQARKALTRIEGLEFKSSAIRVKSVTASSASGADVAADIRLVFRFQADADGRWRVAEVRTGQDRWESLDLIGQALNASANTSDCTAPDPPFKGKLAVNPSVRRARCLLGSLFGIAVPSDALRIQEVDPMPIPMASQPSATVVALVRVDARMTNGQGGWAVTEVRTGNRDWVRLDSLVASLNEQKQKRAQEELNLIASALEKFRIERGFYVVADKQAVAIDTLSPRYLLRVIRVDPWHQPYQYLGERDRFQLRSSGPDGKVDTSDDILVNNK
jgi:hypothetical protein